MDQLATKADIRNAKWTLLAAIAGLTAIAVLLVKFT